MVCKKQRVSTDLPWSALYEGGTPCLVDLITLASCTFHPGLSIMLHAGRGLWWPLTKDKVSLPMAKEMFSTAKETCSSNLNLLATSRMWYLPGRLRLWCPPTKDPARVALPLAKEVSTTAKDTCSSNLTLTSSLCFLAGRRLLWPLTKDRVVLPLVEEMHNMANLTCSPNLNLWAISSSQCSSLSADRLQVPAVEGPVGSHLVVHVSPLNLRNRHHSGRWNYPLNTGRQKKSRLIFMSQSQPSHSSRYIFVFPIA